MKCPSCGEEIDKDYYHASDLNVFIDKNCTHEMTSMDIMVKNSGSNL